MLNHGVQTAKASGFLIELHIYIRRSKLCFITRKWPPFQSLLQHLPIERVQKIETLLGDDKWYVVYRVYDHDTEYDTKNEPTAQHRERANDDYAATLNTWSKWTDSTTQSAGRKWKTSTTQSACPEIEGDHDTEYNGQCRIRFIAVFSSSIAVVNHCDP